MGFLKWLYPGLRVKRWVLLCCSGVILCSMGFALTVPEVQKTSGSLIVLPGVGIVALSIRKILKSMVTVLLPQQREGELVNIIYQKRFLERGFRIAALGGGSGLSVTLHGLKEITSNITAIVTVADDGGSSGRLRSQFGMLAPGDIRNCLVALADAEPQMRDLFQFRFEESGEFQGHNFGNLFILAMLKVTGDFEKAIRESSKILAIRGRVVPSTLKKVSLVAEHRDGTRTEGESSISKVRSPIERIYLKPEGCGATEDALRAIETADAIVIGPGSLYTSILPNLLIEDLAAAIARAPVPKIYVCNVMTQPHETDSLSAFDHVNAIIEHTRPDILSHVIVNTGEIPANILTKYTRENAHPVAPDSAKIRSLGYTVIEAGIVSTTDMIRHNSRKLTKIITDIVIQWKKRPASSVSKQLRKQVYAKAR